MKSDVDGWEKLVACSHHRSAAAAAESVWCGTVRGPTEIYCIEEWVPIRSTTLFMAQLSETELRHACGRQCLVAGAGPMHAVLSFTSGKCNDNDVDLPCMH